MTPCRFKTYKMYSTPAALKHIRHLHITLPVTICSHATVSNCRSKLLSVSLFLISELLSDEVGPQAIDGSGLFCFKKSFITVGNLYTKNNSRWHCRSGICSFRWQKTVYLGRRYPEWILHSHSGMVERLIPEIALTCLLAAA